MQRPRLALAAGLVVSAVLLAAVGGWWGMVWAACQGACAVALVWRPASPGPVAGAMLALFLPTAASIRHWTAKLPGVCHCSRLPHPPPGLVSWTGGAVMFDIVLMGLAVLLAAIGRRMDMRQSSS